MGPDSNKGIGAQFGRISPHSTYTIFGCLFWFPEEATNEISPHALLINSGSIRD